MHLINSLLLIGLMWLFFGDFFINYFNAELIGGWDGTSHYAITKYYAQNIFPNIYGWVPNYYAGMPFPLFYPPLFYFLIAWIHSLTNISIAVIFKGVLLFTTISFPILIYRGSYLLTRSYLPSLISGLLTIFLLGLSDSSGGTLGLSIVASFNSGLVTQLVGGWLFFLWLPHIIKLSHTSTRKEVLVSIFLLTLVLLSNAHVVQVAFLTFCCSACVDIFSKKFEFKKILFWVYHGIFSVGLASIWYIPFLSNYQYSTTKTLSSNVFGSISLEIWIVILLGIFLFIKSQKILNKNIYIKIFFVIASLLIFFLPLQIILPGLPIQANRNIPFIFLIAGILASTGYAQILLNTQIQKWKKGGLVVISLLILYPHFGILHNFIGTYPTSSTDIYKVVDTLEESIDGRSLVEVITTQQPQRITEDPYAAMSEKERQSFFETNRLIKPISDKQMVPSHLIGSISRVEILPDHYALAALLGSNPAHQTIWTVFRESSIHSIFIPMLRNTFSLTNEDFGVTCYLCDEENTEYFSEENINRKISRSDMYNIRYFVFFTQPELKRIEKYSLYLNKIYSSDTWNIYERTQKNEYAQILPYYPNLVFTELKTKDREENGLDWMRLQEFWFREGNFDLPMVFPKEKYIDTESLERYSSIVLVEYQYKDEKQALKNLNTYLKNNRALILYPSSDPLFKKLSAIKDKNITIMNPVGVSEIDIPRLLSTLEVNKISVPNINTNIDNSFIDNSKIHLSLSEIPNKEIPIRISSTYFPLWKNSDINKKVYMTSPVFSLVFTDTQEVSLLFTRNKYDRMGIYISIFFLTLFCLLVIIPNKHD